MAGTGESTGATSPRGATAANPDRASRLPIPAGAGTAPRQPGLRAPLWLALASLLLTAAADGCGSCQRPEQPPPAPEKAARAPTAAPAGTAVATAAPAAPAAETTTTTAAQRSGEPAAPTRAPRVVPPEEAAEFEEGEEDEADCIVLADVDEDFGTPPFTAHFSVEFECEGGGGTVAWDFGDGSPPSYELAPTHTYTQPGEYVARVTVTAPDGLTAYDELDITVEEAEDAGD